MSTKHTPGTWIVDVPLEGQTCITAADHPSNAHPIICRVFDSRHVELSEQEANARLIAAAPELLAFAEMIANGGIEAATISEIESEARALIAKATGTNI